MKKSLIASAVILMFSGNAFSADPSLVTDQDKLSYGLGMMIGERVLKNYGELNYDQLIDGMRAQSEGATTKLSLEEAAAALQAFEQKAAEEKASEAKEAGVAFLAENAKRDGVTVTESGLHWEVMQEADGEKPTADDTVSVHYVGTLIDGSEFDSSIARGQPASFPVKGVIPGWTEGLQLMNVGSKYRFVIPSDLAYGQRGAGQSIGPGETLVFEVELLEIKK
ncbi:MAG: FKBP-type peptidyl-prolyl cis-trans isomerase [Granulosicoccus sp.]|nr:FKBP-type peptidyl-prolyl cis-trans isomerase [Granulosicoccus sp.]